MMVVSDIKFQFMETLDEIKRTILEQSKIIAMVGLSPKPDRPSNMVAQYLIAAGYNVIPVNPLRNEILGRKCYKKLSDIPDLVDIVDVFMRSEKVLPIIEEAIKIRPKCIWLQLGIKNEEAKRLSEGHGITFFMDVCIKQEHARLM